MRALFVLLACACEPWKVESPPAETGATGGETGETEPAPDEADSGPGDSPVESGGGGDTASDTGPLGEGEGEGEGEADTNHPCEPLGLEHGTCCYMIHDDSPNDAIVAVDPTAGDEIVAVVELTLEEGSESWTSTEDYVNDVSGLGREGDTIYACGDYLPVHTLDLEDGVVHEVPYLYCAGATPWRGDAPQAGGIILLDNNGMLHWYAELDSMADGLPEDYLGFPGVVSRLTTYDDVLLAAAHSASSLSRFSLPYLEELSDLPLEGYDSYIWVPTNEILRSWARIYTLAGAGEAASIGTISSSRSLRPARTTRRPRSVRW